MRYGIIADIHANLEALSKAVAFLEEQKVDKFLCLGDIIGYNADPAACIKIIRDKCSHVISGNHERMVLGASLYGVRKETLEATEWTRNQLPAEDLKYIEGLPDEAKVTDKILIVHGSPRDKDEYILSTDAIRENVATLKSRFPDVKVCFFGHSHYPMVIGAPEVHTRFHETRKLDLDPNRIYLINPGSVGQPRDGCPLSSFAIFDDEAWQVTIFRQPYDIPATQKKILDAGIDKKLAARLEVGK
ncbi:MAG TPA: metallophosphoesterase family protein [Planctomycetota bacterium]|nr:metallophosphoesterase family protein [Planctomycetota bacterium]